MMSWCKMWLQHPRERLCWWRNHIIDASCWCFFSDAKVPIWLMLKSKIRPESLLRTGINWWRLPGNLRWLARNTLGNWQMVDFSVLGYCRLGYEILSELPCLRHLHACNHFDPAMVRTQQSHGASRAKWKSDPLDGQMGKLTQQDQNFCMLLCHKRFPRRCRTRFLAAQRHCLPLWPACEPRASTEVAVQGIEFGSRWICQVSGVTQSLLRICQVS